MNCHLTFTSSTSLPSSSMVIWRSPNVLFFVIVVIIYGVEIGMYWENLFDLSSLNVSILSIFLLIFIFSAILSVGLQLLKSRSIIIRQLFPLNHSIMLSFFLTSSQQMGSERRLEQSSLCASTPTADANNMTPSQIEWAICFLISIANALLIIRAAVGSDHNPPIRLSLLSMFTPFLLLTCFPSRNVWRFTFVWLISFAGIVISYALTNQANVHALVYYIAISCLIFLALERQSQRSEEERHELISREEHLREDEIAMADQKMKQMVGNVAHDLKTPLSSFVGNIRLMQESVVEVFTCVQDGFVDAKRLDELFKLLFHCLQTTLQTNDFMLMSINRCIDYTKASRGLALVPKLETIDFRQILQLPIQCMVGAQSTIPVSLIDVPDQIARFLITDKQWLQENVLCLLSNACKFSSSGQVTVSASLVEDGVAPSSTVGIAVPGTPASSASSTLSMARHKCTAHMNRSSHSVTPIAELPNLSDKSDDQNLDQNAGQSIRAECPQHGDTFLSTTRSENELRSFKIRVEVVDEGIGLSEDAMAHLFQPFKQAQRLAGGTGLGLFSLSKRMEALNGSCGVEKRPDGKQGCVFWFAFPYRPDETQLDEGSNHSSFKDCRHTFSHIQKYRSLMRRSYMQQIIHAPSSEEGCGNLASMTTHSLLGESFQPSPSLDEEESAPVTSSASPSVKTRAFPSLRVPRNEFAGMVASTTNHPFMVNTSSPRSLLNSTNKVLIVDDSPVIVKTMTMILQRQGFQVFQAGNGAIALDMIQARITEQTNRCPSTLAVPFYNIILMDLQMPVMDGLETVRRLREFENSYNAKQIEDYTAVHCDEEAMANIAIHTPQVVNEQVQHLLSGINRTVGRRFRSSSLVSTPATPSIVSGANSPRVDRLSKLHHLIIGVSASTDDSIQQEMANSGFDASLAKPFCLSDFLHMLEQLL